MSRKAIIVGCGIAGPVVALLLQKKGYTPVIVEKVRQLGDAGASLMLQPNGMRVLAQLGLNDAVIASSVKVQELLDRTYQGERLGGVDWSTFEERYGHPAVGVKRSSFNLDLKNAVLAAGIELHEGWKLKDIEETDAGVVAVSESGEKIEGGFLIGCDGIKAASRNILLKRKGIEEAEAEFTGLIQTAGISPTPPLLAKTPTIANIYGPSAHLIGYPVTRTLTSWAITQKSALTAQETWRATPPSSLPTQKAQLLAQFKDWSSPLPELVSGAERLIKYGLFDRPKLEPEQWWDGRCVLIGDAAHPTSPHLGQGANQALEDCHHLTRLLPDASAGPVSTAELARVFDVFARLRQPTTAALVAGARKQGQLRVVEAGPEMERRNEVVREIWKDEEEVFRKYDELLLRT